MVLEEVAALRADLAERHGLETARPLQAQREAADTAEKVENLEFHFSPLSSSRASNVSRRPWLMSDSPCSASTSE